MSRSISISRCHEPHTWRLLRLRPRALNSFVSLNWIDPVPLPLLPLGVVSRCICNFASIKERGVEGENLELPDGKRWARVLSCGYSTLVDP